MSTAQDFVGHWNFVSSENFDEYPKKAVGLAIRKMANFLKPTLDFTVEGDHWKMVSSSTFKTIVTEFDINKEFDETTADGRKFKTTFTFKNGKLIQNQKTISSSDKPSTIERFIEDGKLVIKTKSGNSRFVEIYQKSDFPTEKRVIDDCSSNESTFTISVFPSKTDVMISDTTVDKRSDDAEIMVSATMVTTEQPVSNDISCVRDYNFFELCQTFSSHCKADDSTLERFLANGPYGEEDPVLVLSYNDENIGSKVVPGAASIQQKKNLIINALVTNGAQRIGESETAFFFPTWDLLYLARENIGNPTLPNNVHWVFSTPLYVSLRYAASGLMVPATPSCVHSIIIRTVTVTDETVGGRTPSRYLVDNRFQFFSSL